MKTYHLDPDFLHECFNVNFSTGELRWKSHRPLSHFSNERGSINWHNKNPGKIAGHVDANGYWIVKLTIDGQECNLKQHRIVFSMFYGTHDVPLIDHFDGNILNNSISNLRPADHMINSKNRMKSVKNKSGITGVMRRKDRELWVAQIFDGEKNRTKTTADFFEACCFRKSWELKLGYTNRHGKD